MKKLLRKVLLYMVVVVAVNAAITALFSNKYWEKRVPIIKKEITDRSDPELSVVLGSSHAFYGVNSVLLDEGFYNLASISQSYFEDFAVLKNVLRSRKIKAVVIPLNYASNNYYLERSVDIGEQIRVLDYEHIYPVTYVHDLHYQKARLYLIAQTDKAILSKAEKYSFDQYGNMQESCKAVTHNIGDSIIAFERHNLAGGFTTVNPYLDSIISICNANRIKLNIVVFPFTGGYKRAFARKYTRHEFDDFLTAIKQQLPGDNMKLIDCRDLIVEGEAIYFRDADHLSACGRDSLSAYLSRIILK